MLFCVMGFGWPRTNRSQEKRTSPTRAAWNMLPRIHLCTNCQFSEAEHVTRGYLCSSPLSLIMKAQSFSWMPKWAVGLCLRGQIWKTGHLLYVTDGPHLNPVTINPVTINPVIRMSRRGQACNPWSAEWASEKAPRDHPYEVKFPQNCHPTDRP